MRQNDKENPFIHLFQTAFGYYLYDINTNQIIKIKQDTYERLSNQEKGYKTDTNEEIEILYENGYLKNNKVQNVNHPYTELLPYALENKIHILILQVTQNCNLRCDYCLYSGKYNTRSHQNKRMNFSVAKEAIDFLKEHSKEKRKVYIAFYGGEPLLEFELIKKCVTYAENIMKDKEIEYSMTTNGTLLSPVVIEYLKKYKFKITVSLDGPKEVQDRSRRFANSDKGSFDVIIENLKYFRKRYPRFYNENVGFNSVISTEYNFLCSDNYFKEDELFKNSKFVLSGISESFSKSKVLVSSRYVEEEQYEIFKLFLSLFSRIDKKEVSLLLTEYLRHLINFKQKLENGMRNELPITGHRSGPCIPGITRLFVNAEGDFFPCEKVSELSKSCKIGTLKEGFWRGKVENLLNIEKITHDECCNCWVYSECTNCARHCDDCIAHDRKNILDTCKQVRNSVEETFKDYTVLKELGYDFCIKSEEDILNSTEKEEINAPILAIGNFWIDAQNESLKVAELIYDQMAKIGYRVAILLEEELIENVPSFSNNILNINKRIKKCEIEENPDLIIVVVPGNIVEVSDKLCGDSGTYLYMLSQSISIDSMIVNIPYFTELLQESQNVNNEIERIVGIKAYINVLPKYLDIAVSEEEGRADYLTLSTNFIIDKINKIDDERLYCSDDYESLSSLTMQIIDELSSYAGNNEVQEINNIVIEDVEEKVMEIIKQIGEKDCAIDCLKNESLFGEKIKMRARDMLVVFFELEKQFDICFTEDDIKDYTFVSIEKISACIKKHLNK